MQYSFFAKVARLKLAGVVVSSDAGQNHVLTSAPGIENALLNYWGGAYSLKAGTLEQA